MKEFFGAIAWFATVVILIFAAFFFIEYITRATEKPAKAEWHMAGHNNGAYVFNATTGDMFLCTAMIKQGVQVSPCNWVSSLRDYGIDQSKHNE